MALTGKQTNKKKTHTKRRRSTTSLFQSFSFFKPRPLKQVNCFGDRAEMWQHNYWKITNYRGRQRRKTSKVTFSNEYNTLWYLGHSFRFWISGLPSEYQRQHPFSVTMITYKQCFTSVLLSVSKSQLQLYEVLEYYLVLLSCVAIFWKACTG